MGRRNNGVSGFGLDHHLENRFYTHDLGLSYPELLSQIINGRQLDSRNGGVREIDDASLVLTIPERCIVERDHFSRAFMDMEIVSLLAGRHEDALLRGVTPKAADMITPKTAYGPRTWEQLLAVEDELVSDRYSRRAVVYIGRKNDLLHSNDADRAGEMPCTCLWQFMIRPLYNGNLEIVDALYMNVYMRSWDAVWGLAYDVPCFVAVQMALAEALDLPLGHYRHHAGSLHVYQEHFPLALSARKNDNDSRLDVSLYLRPTMRQTQKYCSDVVDHRLRELNDA